jgi:hypothetical protein
MNASLIKKMNSVAKNNGKIRRLLNSEESASIIEQYNVVMGCYEGLERGWFNHSNAQLVVSQRECGQWVLYAL